MIAPTHAAHRAYERYGIRLDWKDLSALIARCNSGEGLMESLPGGKAYHALVLGERLLWIVFRRPCEGFPRGAIITIMPPSSANARGRRDFRFKLKRTR